MSRVEGFSPRRMREAAEARGSSGGETKSSRVRDALSAVNPVVIGIYVVHVIALTVVYISASMDYGLTFPSLALAVLSAVELMAVKGYLDQREAVQNARQQNAGPTGATPTGPFRRAQSGSDGE